VEASGRVDDPVSGDESCAARAAAEGGDPMYCSTCGSRVAEGRATCQVCGAVASRMGTPSAYAPQPYVAPQPVYAAGPVQVCPRCGYRGVSSSYFSQGGHIAALVVSAVMFFPAAIAYLVLRGNHRACPACGYGWGAHGVRALSLMPNAATPMPALNEPALPVAGSAKKGWGIALLVFAGILMAGGLANLEAGPIIFGMLFAFFGGFLVKRAKTQREERRDAILQSLQLPVMQLAARKGGRLTVTDVATEMAWPMARAEKVLNSMDDGLRVMSDITDDGVIVYDFVEIRTAQLARGGTGSQRFIETRA
jgi:hypothetical protein